MHFMNNNVYSDGKHNFHCAFAMFFTHYWKEIIIVKEFTSSVDIIGNLQSYDLIYSVTC